MTDRTIYPTPSEIQLLVAAYQVTEDGPEPTWEFITLVSAFVTEAELSPVEQRALIRDLLFTGQHRIGGYILKLL